MRSQTAGCFVLSLTSVLACGDDSSTRAEPDAGGQPGDAGGAAVDAGGVDGGVDAMPPVCGELVTEVPGSEGPVYVSDLVVDETRIYWLELHAGEGMYIKQVDKSGGDVNVVALEFGSIYQFVVDGDMVFYAHQSGVSAAPAGGGDPVPLSDASVFHGQIAVDASRVYWVEPLQPDSGRVVLARPKDGSTEAVEILIDFDEEGAIEDLAVDEAGLYFFDGVNPVAMRAPREGGLAEPLGTSGRSTIEELAVIDDHVYWRTQGNGSQGGPIYRAPRDQVSSEKAQVVAGLSDDRGGLRTVGNGIKVHAGYLYAVDERLGLKRFSLDGGDPSGELVEEEIRTGSFAVDDDGIFFHSREGQSQSIRVAPLTGCP
jgi:hypothetical protein